MVVSEGGTYQQRIVDDELTELLPDLAAVALEGPKGVGKTRTALQYARTVRRLDDPAELAVAQAAPERLLDGERPVLLDEWQRLPSVWDLVRRQVDDGAPADSFLLTGSAVPDQPPTHSGAGRIVSVRMRPFSLAERFGEPTVGVGALLGGGREAVTGTTGLTVEDYADEVLASELPGIRGLSGRARRRQLEGYLERVVDRDVRDDAGRDDSQPGGAAPLDGCLRSRVVEHGIVREDPRRGQRRRGPQAFKGNRPELPGCADAGMGTRRGARVAAIRQPSA